MKYILFKYIREYILQYLKIKTIAFVKKNTEMEEKKLPNRKELIKIN